MASRMQSTGLPRTTQVTSEIYDLVEDDFELTLRGPVELKGRGPVVTYITAPSVQDEGIWASEGASLVTGGCALPRPAACRVRGRAVQCCPPHLPPLCLGVWRREEKAAQLSERWCLSFWDSRSPLELGESHIHCYTQSH